MQTTESTLTMGWVVTRNGNEQTINAWFQDWENAERFRLSLGEIAPQLSVAPAAMYGLICIGSPAPRPSR